MKFQGTMAFMKFEHGLITVSCGNFVLASHMSKSGEKKIYIRYLKPQLAPFFYFIISNYPGSLWDTLCPFLHII